MYNNNLYLVVFIFFLGNYFQWITEAYRVFDVDGVTTILALDNEKINIECKTDIPINYCGFVHHSGKRYSFSGPTLDAGNCFIKIKATDEVTGQWRCHLGRKMTGIEDVQIINVRIVDEIAALRQNITVVHGKPVTLLCTTTKELRPLNYCRFEPPQGTPFSIDSDITIKNSILNRYYFPKNKSLDRGDCAVTISKVQYEDVGLWTCGVGLDDDKEHIDVIVINVEGLYTMSKASATGIAFAAIGVIAFFVGLGFIVWKNHRLLGGRHRETSESVEVHELGPLDESPQRSLTHMIPKVTVQPPSEASVSPAMS